MSNSRFLFSQTSLERLGTCDQRLQHLMLAALALSPFDFTIICGHRDQAAQDAACAAGKSKTPWPTSKHNHTPSLAVDIAPFPIDWNDTARFRKLADHVLATAKQMGIRVRWGGTFKFADLDHFELED